MISNYYFEILDKANQQLTEQWSLLVNTRSENGIIDKTKLQKIEMDYFQSLQIVLHAVENAIYSQTKSKETNTENDIDI
ncbi:hypothetical protein JT359_06070 [Candidatus Poribacteria bacterium]|nr:hypothetical protein [Candidatus Poribacteria bacterium]